MSMKPENIVGGKGRRERAVSDLYPTPKEATFALLDLIAPFMPVGGGSLGTSLRRRRYGPGDPRKGLYRYRNRYSLRHGLSYRVRPCRRVLDYHKPTFHVGAGICAARV